MKKLEKPKGMSDHLEDQLINVVKLSRKKAYLVWEIIAKEFLKSKTEQAKKFITTQDLFAAKAKKLEEEDDATFSILTSRQIGKTEFCELKKVYSFGKSEQAKEVTLPLARKKRWGEWE